MTMGTKARFWPTLGVLATLSIWTVSAFANVWAGMQSGTDDFTRAAFGAASLSSDVIKVAMIFALTWAIASQRWVVAAVAAVSLILCVTWSVRSAVMFSASQIQQSIADRDHQAQIVTDKRELVRLRSQRAAYLSAQKVDLPGSGKPLREAILAEKERTSIEFEKQISEAEHGLAEIQALPPPPIGDPIARLFGVDEWIVILPTIALFALMVEFLSATGFWVISQSRLGIPVAQARPPRRPDFYQDSGGGGGGGGGVMDTSTNVVGISKGSKGRQKQPAAKASGTLDIVGHQIEREALRRYIKDGNGRLAIAEVHRDIVESIPALHMQNANPARCRHEVRKAISATMYQSLGATKRKIGGQYYFLGLRRADATASNPSAAAV